MEITNSLLPYLLQVQQTLITNLLPTVKGTFSGYGNNPFSIPLPDASTTNPYYHPTIHCERVPLVVMGIPNSLFP